MFLALVAVLSLWGLRGVSSSLRRLHLAPFHREGVVIPLGPEGSGYSGRILEPTVVREGADFYAWYSGLPYNGGGLDEHWNVYYSWSRDGKVFTPGSLALAGAWEQSVVKSGAIYYMAYVRANGFNVRLATSEDRLHWVDRGEIVNANAAWTKTGPGFGPREPDLFKDPVSGDWFVYFGAAAADGKYKIGMARCPAGKNPALPGDWIVQATPFFSPDTSHGRWNDGGDTESPCVEYYPRLKRGGVYLLSFIGYRPLPAVNKSWRIGLAAASSPEGPFTEICFNPICEGGRPGAFDENIVGEVSHLEYKGVFYLYYSGGKKNGANQIGLLTIPSLDMAEWIEQPYALRSK